MPPFWQYSSSLLTPINFHNITKICMSNLSGKTTFTAGQRIFSQGEQGQVMFIILSGKVEIRSNNNLLMTLEEGELFGEMALVDKSPRSADAIALTDCELEEINERSFLFRVGETPFFALKIMRTLAARLRIANQV